MSVDVTKIPFTIDEVTQLSQLNQEPKWLLQNRLEALKGATNLPLPKLEKTNIERWNFTNFKALNQETSIQSLEGLPNTIREFIFDEATAQVLVQKNSNVIFQHISEELSKQGVIFTDLATAARDHEDLVKKYLNQGFKKDEHQLAALHAALQSGGAFLYIPRNIELKVPIQGLFWLAGEQAAILPHILIVAEDHSRLDFVANFVGEPHDTSTLNNSVVEVFVGANAQVRVATVNHLPKSVVDVTYRRSYVERDGHLEWIIADLSEGRIISDNTTHLDGSGSTVHVKTVVMGADEMRSNVTSSIQHWGTHTASDINARSVMKDAASCILNSITKIERGATKSDGQQSGKVLMLNKQARGDANPILLIDENDVTAGHAASVGRIDPLQMYYLMSRGISQAEAEKLIIYGFLDAVISEIPSESLQKRIHQVIERKFQS
ncbi:Fe-S cluster assembly protein SufD [Hazenella coriacea]|uniref:Fe-S cluster assembly protein SufD n=1 Tax=Hazenella coriacea TaxID=1179467 RepID=A0A4R3LHN4_9BACL|nr:Fe-S cluster assembly protein SufD [Hazenella coriacea]TCS97026.1 Fe-S cluster assembly protein SufD [Hazenella coriacea]